MTEALEVLEAQGIHLDAMRIRGFPFADPVLDFVAEHERVFVVEQNRDAQLRLLLVNEGGIDPAKLVPVLHFDGTPITARFVTTEIAALLRAFKVAPLREVAR
jgi:2-oxoglutarate ferredoxin oxidoreductase subunit alpha